MAHNTRIRSTGLWITGSTITQDELEQLDQAQYEAINGDDGGAWAPAAVITIGGSGVTITGEARLSDVIAATWNAGGLAAWGAGSSATFTGSGTIASFDNAALLTVTDDAEFRLNRTGDYLLRAYDDGSGQKIHLYGTMFVKSGAVLQVKSGGAFTADSGSTLSISGDVDLGASAVVTRASGSTDTYESGATLTVQSGATLDLDSGSTLTNGATETRTGPTTRSGALATEKLRMATLSIVADDTIDISADVWVVPSSLTTTRTYTVDTTGAANGMLLHIVHSDAAGVSAGVFYLESSAGPTLFYCASAYHAFVTLVFYGSDWQILHAKNYNNASLAGTGLYGN